MTPQTVARGVPPLGENRAFLRLWSAALLSNYGSMVRGVALPWLAVLVLDAEPRHMALLGAADLGRALLLVAVGAGALAGRLGLEALYAAAFALGALNFLFGVANAAYLPSLVARTQLLAANSRLKAAEAVAEGAAFASAGWLVQWLGAPLALLVDAASFLASALLIGGIRAREDVAPQPRSAALRLELSAGLREIAGSRWLRRIALAAWLCAFGHQVVGVVYMLYVTRELGFAPGPLGLVFAVGAASSFCGALAAARAGARFGPRRAMAGGLALAGAAIALLPLAPATSAVGLALLVAHQLGDGADVLYDVNERSLRQRLVASARLGRVSGSLRVGELGAMLLASAVGGGLGEALGLRTALLVGAAGLALAALAIAARAQAVDAAALVAAEGGHHEP